LYWDIIDVPPYQHGETVQKVNLNNQNLVLKFTFREFSALFPGDSASPGMIDSLEEMSIIADKYPASLVTTNELERWADIYRSKAPQQA
jgi:beta-lactamase superfamily II metal-dependent hydrolase